MQSGHPDMAPQAPRYAPTVPASFSIMSTRSALIVAGHTTSASHEHRLRASAAQGFPDLEFEADFRPLGVAPDWWDIVTTALLDALVVVDAARVSITDDSVRIRGIVSNRALAEPRLRAVQAVLPDEAGFDLNLTAIDPNLSPDELCERQLGELRFAPVYFDESGTRMRNSAFQVLEQVAAFADACRNTTVLITGHTDSSGPEAYNQLLSLERARVVSDWLRNSGIDEDRLKAAGAGSSLPIADNATRFGRSLNRRIDISFASTRPK